LELRPNKEAESGMSEAASLQRYQDGGRTLRRIIDIMEKGDMTGQDYIGFQNEPMDQLN
jgi:hypothetical protein